MEAGRSKLQKIIRIAQQSACAVLSLATQKVRRLLLIHQLDFFTEQTEAFSVKLSSDARCARTGSKLFHALTPIRANRIQET